MNNIKGSEDLLSLLEGAELPPEANLQLADPKLVAYYSDYARRVIWIDKDIDDSLFNEIRNIINWNRADELAHIPVEERLPIKLLIHSYGGNLDAAFAMIDAIHLSKTPIITVNMQSALSAGCLLLINGHKGKRYCLPMSQALIHSGSGGAGGTYEQVVAQTENYKVIMKQVNENIKDHTNLDNRKLSAWKGKEVYLYADDQIKYGLVDEVLKDISTIL